MRPAARRVLASVALVSFAGCTGPVQTTEPKSLVNQTGTCSATPQRFAISKDFGESVTIYADPAVTGLPTRARFLRGNKWREGDFLLYGGVPEFRLCRARRVGFALHLVCWDGTGAPVCEATITETPAGLP